MIYSTIVTAVILVANHSVITQLQVIFTPQNARPDSVLILYGKRDIIFMKSQCKVTSRASCIHRRGGYISLAA